MFDGCSGYTQGNRFRYKGATETRFLLYEHQATKKGYMVENL